MVVLGDQRCVCRCCMCYKSCTATCKTCTLSKLSFYSIRMVIDKNMQVKKDKGEEIERLLSTPLKMEEEMNNTTSNIRSLQMEIERRKSLQEEKRKLISEYKQKKERHRKNINILNGTIQKFAKNLEKKPKNESTRDEILLVLEKQRTLWCRYMFDIYPLRKVDDVYVMRNAGMQAVPQKESLLNRFYTNSSLAMRNCLSFTLSSVNRHQPDAHSLALLVFSSHLVQVLARILDMKLPCELTIHSLISTREAFRSQWTKMSTSVSYVCSSLGVKVSDPHNSLICLFERLCEGPIRLNSSLPLIQFEPSHDQSDMEESNEWDTCDDFDPLTASVMTPQNYYK
ncbi:hypothetical protein PRIPAC_76587 [Pristionchus pacificus]|uniref:Uncharacterized protein n=1 Tax=Pristionchus pacificus TaxID=54126 RepID=A0A2A6C595_PRIPA|nr:hypothetical protein PRIPAC_76587 [Pristionchus pacificus]|eukprot:PDM73344.1 hypothetical protein PRIPAC_40700 [Pristionchus pacificus]